MCEEEAEGDLRGRSRGGKGGCFETLEASGVSPTCASRRSVGRRLSGGGATAVPVHPLLAVGTYACRCGTHRHTPRSYFSQCGWRAWRADGELAAERPMRGPGRASRQLFPNTQLPASRSLPEPHLKSTPLHPPNSPPTSLQAHLLFTHALTYSVAHSTGRLDRHSHFSLIYGAQRLCRTCYL